MPYNIRKAGKKWEVVKKGTDKVMGTHDTEDEAMDQLKALYANEGDGDEDPRVKAMKKRVDG